MTKLLSMFPMMLCVVLVNSLFLAKDSDAANVISYMQSGCTHKIEGEIREEDVLRVKNIVGKDYIIFDEGGAFDVARPVFCLDSGGGSFIAGLQISYFFMEQGISTKIEKLDSCLSSCGIIFLGGSIRLEDTHRPNRTMVSGATLGLHAPYLSRENDLNYTEIQASEIFDLATFAMTATLSVFTYKSVFHDKMWVDPSLIAETNLFGRDEFLLITKIDQAYRWDISIEGFEPPADELTFRDLVQTCINFQNWSVSASSYDVSMNGTYERSRTHYLQATEPKTDGFFEVFTGGEYSQGCLINPQGQSIKICTFDSATGIYRGKCPSSPIYIDRLHSLDPNLEF